MDCVLRSARIGRRAGVTPEEEETGAVDRNRVIPTSDRKTDENVDLAWTVVSSRRLGGRPKRLVCKEPTDVGVRVLGLRPGCSDDREGIRDESSWDFDLREGVRVELTAPGGVGERSRGVVAKTRSAFNAPWPLMHQDCMRAESETSRRLLVLALRSAGCGTLL